MKFSQNLKTETDICAVMQPISQNVCHQLRSMFSSLLPHVFDLTSFLTAERKMLS